MPATAELAGPASGDGVTEAAGAAKHARKRTPTGAWSALGGRGRVWLRNAGGQRPNWRWRTRPRSAFYPICTLEPRSLCPPAISGLSLVKLRCDLLLEEAGRAAARPVVAKSPGCGVAQPWGP